MIIKIVIRIFKTFETQHNAAGFPPTPCTFQVVAVASPSIQTRRPAAGILNSRDTMPLAGCVIQPWLSCCTARARPVHLSWVCKPLGMIRIKQGAMIHSRRLAGESSLFLLSSSYFPEHFPGSCSDQKADSLSSLLCLPSAQSAVLAD